MAFQRASVHARWRAPKGPWVVQYFLAASSMASSQSSRLSRGLDSRLGSIVVTELELEDMVGGAAWGLPGEKL